MLLIHCDGSIADQNPGGRGFTGWVIQAESGEVIRCGSNALGTHPEMSNNVAEYGAVLAALNHLVATGQTTQGLRVFSDSQLIVRQLTGEYRCAKPVLRYLRDVIWSLAKKFPSAEYIWIPREQNKEADRLSKSLWKCVSPA